MNKLLIALVILTVFALGFFILPSGENQPPELSAIAETTFTDFDGNPVSLAAYAGRPVYIKFWASWCSVCLTTLADTDAMAAADNDFTVLTVVAPDVSGEKSAEAFKTWYNQLGYTHAPVLFDTGGAVLKTLGITAFPTSVYIGADGALIRVTPGYASAEEIAAVFNGSIPQSAGPVSTQPAAEAVLAEPADAAAEKTICLAGGCFWGVEAYLAQIPGVLDAASGYANGNGDTVTYEEVCYDNTGHAETVRVLYDSDILPLSVLLDSYFTIIDPTTVNRQGNDVGSQYRTGIYYTDEADLPVIEAAVARVQERYTAPVTTEVLPLANFCLAEEYHQDYLEKNPNGYCHIDLTVARETALAGWINSRDVPRALPGGAQAHPDRYPVPRYPGKRYRGRFFQRIFRQP